MNEEKGQNDDMRFSPDSERCACGIDELKDEKLLTEREREREMELKAYKMQMVCIKAKHLVEITTTRQQM